MFALGALIVGAAVSSSGDAAQAHVQLLYRRGADVAACPDEAGLRAAVSVRIGYDPFVGNTARHISATLVRRGRGFQAEVVATDVAGKTTGSRTLTSDRDDCGELAAAMALAISIAVDPLALGRPTPAAVALAAPHPSPSPPGARRTTVGIAVGGHAATGATPGVAAVGADARLEGRWPAASVGLEARLDPQVASAAAGSGRVGARLLVGELVPCVRRKALAVCLIAGLGVMQGVALDVAAPRRDSSFYAAAGGRVALEFPIAGSFALDVHVDGLAALVRTTLELDGAAVWTTPLFSGAVGSALLASY